MRSMESLHPVFAHEQSNYDAFRYQALLTSWRHVTTMPGAGVGHSFANTGGSDFDVVGTTMQNGFRRFTFLALLFGNGKTACNVHIHFANCGLPLRAARVLGAYLPFVIFTDTFVDISTCSFCEWCCFTVQTRAVKAGRRRWRRHTSVSL